ncbi:hypothetical protein BKA69DRAFT_1080161 [Paraphysoderma sedebokerense]|nr:hypothetical protein BKA69DRAFT_1080161 [Paraphysoderma sedebokerense]
MIRQKCIYLMRPSRTILRHHSLSSNESMISVQKEIFRRYHASAPSMSENNWFKRMKDMVLGKEVTKEGTVLEKSPEAKTVERRKKLEARAKQYVQPQKSKSTQPQIAHKALKDVLPQILSSNGMPSSPEPYSSIPLTDDSLKFKVLSQVATLTGVIIPSKELMNIHTVNDIVEQYNVTKEGMRSDVVKHPVAAWFQDQRRRRQLPGNVRFIEYQKHRKFTELLK